jgi:hypothetical protein
MTLRAAVGRVGAQVGEELGPKCAAASVDQGRWQMPAENAVALTLELDEVFLRGLHSEIRL